MCRQVGGRGPQGKGEQGWVSGFWLVRNEKQLDGPLGQVRHERHEERIKRREREKKTGI